VLCARDYSLKRQVNRQPGKGEVAGAPLPEGAAAASGETVGSPNEKVGETLERRSPAERSKDGSPSRTVTEEGTEEETKEAVRSEVV
jgi:hypothetical protein